MTEEIRDITFEIERDFSSKYGNGSLKEIIDYLMLLQHQKKYMDNYYGIPKKKERL